VIQGGDKVAAIVTMLLLPFCLADTRTWTWSAPREPASERLRGSAYAGHALLRLQIFVIYVNSVLAKLRFSPWRDGTALRDLVNNPEYGVPLALRPIATRLLAYPVATDSLTWLVLLLESLIAVLVFCGPRGRRVMFLLGAFLHLLVLLLMGIFSFSLTMIATLAIAAAGHGSPDSTLLSTRAVERARGSVSSEGSLSVLEQQVPLR
jgi:antimicrobial peptide system SdpB family protein